SAFRLEQPLRNGMAARLGDDGGVPGDGRRAMVRSGDRGAETRLGAGADSGPSRRCPVLMRCPWTTGSSRGAGALHSRVTTLRGTGDAMPSPKIIIVASCALVLAAVSPAAAKSGPKTGTYK